MSDPPSSRRRLFRRLVVWALAITALIFVIRAVPVRDRCIDPSAPEIAATSKSPPMVAMTRDGDGAYVLHTPRGDVRMDAAKFDPLKAKCEPGLVTTLKQANVAVVIALAFMYVIGSFAWAVRWRMLLLLADMRVSLRWVWRVTLEAQAGGVLLPGGIASDALRITSMVGKGAPTATVVASVMLDRVVGLVTLAGLSVALAVFFGGATSLGAFIWMLGAIPVGFVVGIALLRIPALARLSIFQTGRLAKIVKPVLLYIGDPRAPRAILAGVLVSIIVSAVQLAAIRGSIFALGVTPEIEREVYVGAALAMIVTAIPTLPGGWGTADAAYVYFLSRAGLKPPIALAVCLMFRLLWYLLAAIGTVLFVMRGGRAEPSSAAADPARDASS